MADLRRQFEEEPLRLSWKEEQAAREAVARWNGFVDGRKRGIEAAQEEHERAEAAFRPGLTMAAIGFGAQCAALLPHADVGGLMVALVGIGWTAWGAYRLRRTR